MNTAPKLLTTALSLEEDAVATQQISASDAENDPLTFAIAANPQHGALTVTAAGFLTYTPAANFAGADSLDIQVSDSAGAKTTGTIAITVNPVDDAPLVTTTQLVVDEDTVLHAQLAGTDVEGDAFNYVLTFNPTHGDLVMNAAGSLTYTPRPDYFGPDQFRVRTHETNGVDSAEQVIHIDVHNVNDAPVAQPDTLYVAANGGKPVEIPVLDNDTDKDGDVLTPVVVTQPRGGTLSVDATTHKLLFAPANGYVGPVEFTYQVTDGSANSAVVSARAMVGDFEPIIFLSDYTTPGRPEVHVFDGFEVKRVSDTMPAGYTILAFSVSGDLRTMALTVDGPNDRRAYVQPMDGSSPAVLRYTAPKTSAQYGGLSAYLNSDGTYLLVYDYYQDAAHPNYVVNVATGTTTQLGANMGLVALRYADFHAYDPKLIVVQGQTEGPYQPSSITQPMTKEMYIADAANPATLTRIGPTHSLNHWAGEGYYFGRDPRIIYYNDYVTSNGPPYASTNIWAYDRVTGTETPVVRYMLPSERGINGSGWGSPDGSHMCFGVYEQGTTAYDGASRFYAMDLSDPASAKPVSPVLNDISQCTMASDNHSVIYRIYALNRTTQWAYLVDSVNPGTPVLLAPNGEANSKQLTWQAAPGAMRMAIAYFDDDGQGYSPNQVGRFYSLPLDGNGTPFLFSDNYQLDFSTSYTTFFYDSNEDGSFVLYGRPRNGIAALELMSTHGLNLSIPLSGAGETVGLKYASWLHRYPR